MRASGLVVALAVTLVSSVAIAQDAPSRPPVVRPAMLVLGQGDTGGREKALDSLMAAVARRSSIEKSDEGSPVLRATDVALFDHPLVFVSGSEDFGPLPEAERDALRAYLSTGGMLVLDDRSGVAASPFMKRARAEISRALGGRSFVPLRDDHALYRAFYLLEGPHGRVDVEASLPAIEVGGRAAVLASSGDLLGACERDALGAWARDVEPGGLRQRELAIRFGVNVLLYALTLDYKEDLVHLPMILERGR